MVAIKKSGIINFEIKDGSFNGESFMCFIENKLTVHFQNNNDDILIMDNCSFHHRSDVIALLDSKNIKHRFLPAYSPQLNPIEEYFSYFKSKLSSFHAIPTNSEELKIRAVSIFNNENIGFAGWFLNMRRFINMAKARQPFI
ncbi:hypothetical protein DMUE_2386 [Dictyocoela muelleri]|nr:hypothetical protein DMUE_2386 [Dictyocoela muelleri]